MKRDGCDGLICPMCKTQLCWATKGRFMNSVFKFTVSLIFFCRC